MPRREPPNPKPDIPPFPRPHIPKPPSPYRARIAPSPPAPEPPPAESMRVVVTRPEPPPTFNPPRRRLYVPDPDSPPDPVPAGLLDEARRKVAPFTTAVSNHPYLVALILVLVYALWIGAAGRELGACHFF